MENKGIKVCHLTSAHSRYDRRILQRQCISLVNNGYEVWLIVNDNLPDEIYEGVNIKSTGHFYNANRLNRMTDGVNRIYDAALQVEADIYQFHDPELLTIALKLKRRKKRIIFDSHEYYTIQILTKEYLPRLVARVLSLLYFKYETYVVKHIDGVIVPSEGELKYSFRNRVRRLTYIDNLPKMSDVQMPDWKEYAKKRDVCYSGSLTYSRGIEHLAEAAKKAGVILHLAGQFSSDDFKYDVVRTAEKFIVYHGQLDRDELKEFYSECLIGMCTLLPIGQYDKMTNLPTKAYEYMGMGMPMIISDFPYNRSFIEKYHVGLLVDPENTDDIAEKITYLLANPKVALDMGKRGRHIFENEYNWEKCEEALIKLYEDILK